MITGLAVAHLMMVAAAGGVDTTAAATVVPSTGTAYVLSADSTIAYYYSPSPTSPTDLDDPLMGGTKRSAKPEPVFPRIVITPDGAYTIIDPNMVSSEP